MAKTPFQRLQQFFGLRVQTKKDPMNIQGTKKEVVPAERSTGRAQKFSSEVERLWNWYTNNADSPETLKNREDRYADMDYMIYNDTVVSSALDLYADEVAQADSQQKPIAVYAKKKEVQREIYNLLENWGVDQNYIRECAYNLVGYGDSFDVIDYDRAEGIVGLTPVDIRDVVDRLEFKYSEIAKQKKGLKAKLSATSISVQKFIQNLETDKSDSGFNFSSYLLGFVLSDKTYRPPWGVNHYRLFSRRSEFFPFGRPMFIHLVGPFRQLKTAKNLMALVRVMSFPKEVYEVKTDDEMSEVEQWDAVNEARQEYQNSGMINQNKEEFSVNSEIWLPEGLLRMTVQENNLRVEDIQDIELLRDDLIMGTRIPKGYLIVDRGGWGTSSQSLLQQSKPFGRSVYSIQSVILQNLAHLIRMHFLMTGKFDKEATEFELSLRFPVVEEASDRLRMKTDTLRLANDVLDNIKNALGMRNDDPPPEVVKKIFSQFSFLSVEDVDFIVNSLSKNRQEDPEEEKALSEGYKELKEELIKEAYSLAVKKERYKEGIRGEQHVFVSNIQNISPEEWKIYTFLQEEVERNKLDEEQSERE